MIPANHSNTQIQIILQLLSLIHPVSAGEQTGEKSKKTADLFNGIIDHLDQRPNRTISFDHSVQIIKTLLCHQYKCDPQTAAVKSNLSMDNQSSKASDNNFALHRLIQSSVAQIIHFSSRNCKNSEQFTLICQAAAGLIEKMNQSMSLFSKDCKINEGEADLLSMHKIAAVQLKPAMDHLVLSLERFEGGRTGKEVSRQTIECSNFSTQISKPSSDSSKLNLQIKERGDFFRFFSSDSSQKKAGNSSFRPLPLSAQAKAVSIINSAPHASSSVSASIVRPQDPFRSRSSHESVVICATEVKGVPVIVPYQGAFSNNTFLVARQKKDKKKRTEDEEREKNDSSPDEHGFEF